MSESMVFKGGVMPVNPGKGLWMTWNMRYNEKRR